MPDLKPDDPSADPPEEPEEEVNQGEKEEETDRPDPASPPPSSSQGNTSPLRRLKRLKRLGRLRGLPRAPVGPGSPTVLRGLWFLLCGLFLGLFAGAYLTIGSHLIQKTNTSDADLRGGDQRHNIKLAVMAKQIREGEGPYAGSSQLGGLLRKLPHYTDGVVAPLWPWTASFLVPDGMGTEIEGPDITVDERQLFQRGKRFLLVAGCVFLVATGTLLLRFFSLPAVFVVLLGGGLGALLQRSAHFQPEVLSYIFLALSWALVLLLLRQNGLLGYLLLGVSLGLAYLTKTSVQPLFAGFLIATTLRWFLVVRHGGTPRHPRRWSPFGHCLGLLVFALAFGLVTGPRLLHSKRHFGSMTHSYPSYWMWMDEFEDAYLWMQNHGDAAAIARVDKDDLPGLSHYLGDHTIGDLGARLSQGTSSVLGRFFSPPKALRGKSPPRPWKLLLEHRGTYLALLALLALAMVIQHALLRRDGDGPPPFDAHGVCSAVFVLSTFGLAALAYGWYSPVGKGDRFLLSLYLPLILSLVWVCERLHQRLPLDRRAGRIASRLYLAAISLLCAALVWRTIELLDRPEFA